MPRVIYDGGHTWLVIKRIFICAPMHDIDYTDRREKELVYFRNFQFRDKISWKQLLQNWGWIK